MMVNLENDLLLQISDESSCIIDQISADTIQPCNLCFRQDLSERETVRTDATNENK